MKTKEIKKIKVFSTGLPVEDIEEIAKLCLSDKVLGYKVAQVKYKFNFSPDPNTGEDRLAVIATFTPHPIFRGEKGKDDDGQMSEAVLRSIVNIVTTLFRVDFITAHLYGRKVRAGFYLRRL